MKFRELKKKKYLIIHVRHVIAFLQPQTRFKQKCIVDEMHAKCTIPVALLKISPGDTRNSLSVLLNYASKPIDDEKERRKKKRKEKRK